MSQTAWNSWAIFLLSLTAIPLTYIVNTAQTLHGELGLMVSGVVLLSALLIIVYLVIGRGGRSVDWLYYVLLLGTFSSVVDFIIGMENSGLAHGFMTRYLESGEPYLTTPYGTMICFWDGIAHYIMYLIILWCLAKKQSYREVGLYWAGSIGHSMIVFIPGNLVGKFGIHWSFLLNTPYMIFPYVCAARFLRERKGPVIAPSERQQYHRNILSRPVDFILVLSCVGFMAIACLRAFAVLGCYNDLIQSYIDKVEPYLNDPVAYPKMQMLVYFFYFVPFYVMAIYGLVSPGHSWLPDWTILHAGAVAQAQFAHIGSSLHPATDVQFHVPSAAPGPGIFWTVNLALLIIPQLMAWRCHSDMTFFTPVKPDALKKKK